MSRVRLHASYSPKRDDTRPSAVPCSYSWGLQPWFEKGKAAFPPGRLPPKQIAAFAHLERGRGQPPQVYGGWIHVPKPTAPACPMSMAAPCSRGVCRMS